MNGYIWILKSAECVHFLYILISYDCYIFSKPKEIEMKLKYLAIALFPLALVACQSGDIQKSGDLAMSVLQQQNADITLNSYEWSLNTDGASKPLVLKFMGKGSLAISTTCNNLSSSWSVENNVLTTGNMASTLMACTGNGGAQEKLAAEIFSTQVPFVLNLNDKENPTLTLTTAKNEKFTFTGKMTPETKYQTAGETIFLEVSAETKKCTGMAPQNCLQVREIKYSEQGLKTQIDKDWTLFYDKIEGFTHTSNERQVIRVKRFEIKNPAADQSKYAYVHDMTIEREAVKGAL